MAYETKFVIRQMLLNSSSFTDLQGVSLLPIPCNSVFIVNNLNVTVLLRTDPANVASQVSIPPGTQWELGNAVRSAGTAFRFEQNCDPVCSLMLASGAPAPILIESFQ